MAALGRPVLRGISDIVSVNFFRLFTRLFLYAVFKEHLIDARSSRLDVRIELAVRLTQVVILLLVRSQRVN